MDEVKHGKIRLYEHVRGMPRERLTRGEEGETEEDWEERDRT